MQGQYLSVAAETQGHYLVGMSPEEFIQTFMPWNVDTPAAYREKPIPEERLRDLHNMASKKHEKDMYSAFTAALQGWPIKEKKEAHGASVIVTKFGEYRKPDGDCRGFAVDTGHYTEDNLPSEKATVHRLMETNAEFKVSAAADPFVDLPENADAPTESTEHSDAVDNAAEHHRSFPDGVGEDPSLRQPSSGFCSSSIHAGAVFSSSVGSAVLDVPTMENDWPGESKSELGQKTRGQIASYVGITMFLSYRKHFMSVVVFGTYARLIFWDRCGAVVSRRFNYQDGEGDKILFKFYLRFSQLTAEQRGYDPTVVEIPRNDPDAKAALVQFQKYDRDMWHCNAQTRYEMGATLPEDHFLRMTVKFGDSAERSFIVPAPIFEDTCISPFSRSTRRSLAYDCSFTRNPGKERDQLTKSKHGSLLFMKDYWREESPGTRPEAEIYDILAEKKVPHVATMVAGGDVEGMRTQTHEACFKLSAYPLGDSSYFRLQNPLQCHRIFLDTVARDLSAFGDCKVLVNCIADAMEAAQCAFAYARIMHRDISSGNIMITPAHRGLLIDWDLCLVLDSEALTHHPQRTGTWQFMSIGLLQGGKDKEPVVNTLDDDKESAFWVLFHTALRYLKHSLEPTELSQKLLNLFDSKALDEFGRPKGGQFKWTELPACAHDSNELATFKVPGFNNLLTELAGLLLVRYRQPTAEAVQRYEARLEKGGEVDEDNPVAIYKAKLERLADPNWLHETLRRHAKKIPLPTQPLPAISLFSQPGRAGAERAPEGSSPVTMYDFHRNEISSEEVGIEDLHARSPASISQRLDGMGWRRFVEHGTGDDGPAHKKRKLGGSKKACAV